MPENSLAPAGAIKDYTDQPYDRETYPPTDPGETVVRDRLRNQLESGNYPKLNHKYEFELGTPDVCDPVEAFVCNEEPVGPRERERRCDLWAGGQNQDPDPGRTLAINHPDLYVQHQGFQRLPENWQLGDPLVSTALKKGWTRPGYVKDWAGWGWRHIRQARMGSGRRSRNRPGHAVSPRA